MSNGKYPRAPFGQGGFLGKNDPVTSHRAPVDKAKSAGEFRRNTSRTKAANVYESQSVGQGPMRGGIRL